MTKKLSDAEEFHIGNPTSKFESDALEGGWNGWNLSERLQYILGYRHYSLESGADANVMLNRMLPHIAGQLSTRTTLRQEYAESLGKVRQYVTDAHSTLGEVRTSQLPMDKVLRRAVFDALIFSDEALIALDALLSATGEGEK